MQYAKHFNTRITPQSEAIPGKAQVRNSAGGFTYALDDWKRLDRFLILGSEGNTYYASEQKLTKENAAAVLRCLDADGPRVVNRILEISESGRAPKNDAAIFALALAAGLGNEATKARALEVLNRVCRISTHLFQFVEAVQGFRGWGRALRRAVGEWYTAKSVEDAAYQMLKYRQRGGWTHRDVLRLAHPRPGAHQALFKFVKTQDIGDAPDLELVRGFNGLQTSSSPAYTAALLNSFPQLTWEMVLSEHLGSAEVWEALLPRMPLGALVRNLGRMTANGAIGPFKDSIGTVVARLGDELAIKKSRLHPVALLGALCTYAGGHGIKGSLTWAPVPQVIDALDKAFYLAFQNVKPTGKRTLLALDVSGSMGGGVIAGMPGLTPRAASAALALVTAAVEPSYHVMGFSGGFIPLNISPRQRLSDVIRTVGNLPFDRTDCALPMLWAEAQGLDVDTFVIYTDNETWAGRIHPSQALVQYRQRRVADAKLVVVGMTATGFTIADPADAGMLDVVGFDTATPSLISDFALGTE